MSFLDKFLNVMRLNPEDDDDFYNEDYDYDDDYTEDEPKQTFRREKKRETVEKESFLASFDDIEKNDFNLNIPRYVDNFEKEEEIDLNELLSEMKKTDEELQQTQTEFMSLLKELTSPDEKIMSSLNNLIEKMEGR